MWNIVKFFLLACIVSNFTLLHAQTYDEDVLTIFSKILPRLVLMSTQKTQIKNSIDICILHDFVDKDDAKILRSKINDSYPNGLKKYKIKLHSQSYGHFKSCKNSQLVFLFNTSSEKIKQILKYTKKHQIISTSYDSKLLVEGVEVSLFIGRKTTPYINVKALQESGIEFDNILLLVSKIYNEMDR